MHSALAFETPKPSPILDLNAVVVPPLGLVLVSPFITNNLNWGSMLVSKIPAAAVAVIVDALKSCSLTPMK